jgi:purine-binding chemotaxis protein CheW
MSTDWNEIRKRIAAASAALETGAKSSPDQAREILRARARALALEPADRAAAGESIKILEFRLACESYGIETPFIREVYPLKALTPLPGTPPFVLGIVNIRGQTCSLIDLKKFFELPEKGLSDLNKVIIVQQDEIEFGILADEIIGLRTILAEKIQPSLPTLTGIRQTYLKGVVDGQLIVLDAAKLLSDRTLIVNEQAAS